MEADASFCHSCGASLAEVAPSPPTPTPTPTIPTSFAAGRYQVKRFLGEGGRKRVSVRRHARLIDYRMHDGASARAFIHLELASGTPGMLPVGTQVLPRIDAPLGSKRPPHGPVIPSDWKEQALEAAGTVFETLTEDHLHANLNEIDIHPWGNQQCCLPRGATSLDLVGDLAFVPERDGPEGDRREVWRLKKGDFLLLEEIKGPETGLSADADPTHRQVVRLTEAKPTQDPLLGIDLTRVTWDSADALTFPLCISAKGADGTPIEKVSQTRGNLVLADHGCTVTEWHPGDPGPDLAHPQVPGIQAGQRPYRFRLRKGPLGFRVAVPEENDPLAPAEQLLITDPRQTVAQVSLSVHTRAAPPSDWEVVPHLLDSKPFDSHFVAEVDNDGRAVIRFGDGQFGMLPPDGMHIYVTYRVGVGPAGNVGRESLVHAINPGTTADWPDIVAVRNPLPAWGGIGPEPIEQVKQLAPAAFHPEQFRAVTERDYALAADKHPQVSKAVATFRWTGSWHTVFITVDPVGRTDLPTDLEQSVRAWVTRYTQAGYDLKIEPPHFVPLEIEIEVYVAASHFRVHVEEALLMALSNQLLPDGRRGFFHPDNFTFGQALHLSQLYAAVEAVEGVDSAVVTKFQRYGRTLNNELEQGCVPIGRLEVVQLDNDPNFPENGVLRLNMLGGK